jgi:hypothetical protein
MRLSCFILPCSARSGTPGRSLRNASYANFTCLHVEKNTRTFAWAQQGTLSGDTDHEDGDSQIIMGY